MGIIDATKRFMSDGFKNVVTSLGTAQDASAYGAWYVRPYSREEIEASFRTSWAAKKAHQIPVTDTVRPWRQWKAEDDQITALEREERRLGLRQKVRKALLWSRLYGGAAIVLGVDGDDMAEPLELDRIKQGGLSYIHAMHRHEITVQEINTDPGSPQYGEPLFYIVNAGGRQTVLHPTRVVRFAPSDLSDNAAFEQGSWGDPLLASMHSALMNADSAQGHFAALIAKARTGTLEIPGLVNIVSTKEGEQQFIERTRVTQMFESMMNLRVISAPARKDDPGEKLTFEQVNWSGIPEVGGWFLQLVAAAADVPITRFLGQSPSGLNSTGASDLQNYYQQLSASRELDLRPRLEMIDEALIRSALGDRPESIWFEFGPFEVDDEKTRAENSLKRAQAVKALSESGTVPSIVLEAGVRGQLIDGGEYPGIEEAYREYDAAGEVEPVEEDPAAENDNVLSATIEGLVGQGRSASVAARDAISLLDSTPRPLYVSRKVLNRDDLQAWATEQGLGELQSDLHVTVLYSRVAMDWLEMGNAWGQFGQNEGQAGLIVPEGGPRIVEPLGDRTAVLMFANTDLQYRHKEMVERGASHDYPDYVPHVSLNGNAVDLAGVTPYRGVIRLGPEIFEEIRND